MKLTEIEPSELRALLLPTEDRNSDVRIDAHVTTEEAEFFVVTVWTSEDGGQHLVRLGRREGVTDAILYVDTLVFPLPTPENPSNGIPPDVETEIARQTAKSLAHQQLSEEHLSADTYALRTGQHLGAGATRQLPDPLEQLLTGGQETEFASPAGLPPANDQGVNERLLTAARECLGMDTTKGPDGGNLACVWAVNRVFRKAFGRNLTASIGTAVFDSELSHGKGTLVEEAQRQPGNIIISPSGTGVGHGHVGILGRDDIIYSNASAKPSHWDKRYTLDTWRHRYVDSKHMELRFYQVSATIFPMLPDALQQLSEIPTELPNDNDSIRRFASADVLPEDAVLKGVSHQTAPTLAARRETYRHAFESCAIRVDKAGAITDCRLKMLAGRKRYDALGSQLNKIPWYFIAIIHSLECGSRFDEHLHNGDPLTARTIQAPEGRPPGPPSGGHGYTWEESARDALTMRGKEFDRETDWSLEAQLYLFEKYNGWGYYWRKLPSPYLWNFSDQSGKGKFTHDHVFDPHAGSDQVGAAVLLKDLVNRGIITL